MSGPAVGPDPVDLTHGDSADERRFRRSLLLQRWRGALGQLLGLRLHLGEQLPEVRPAAEGVEVRLLQFSGEGPAGLDDGREDSDGPVIDCRSKAAMVCWMFRPVRESSRFEATVAVSARASSGWR